MLSPSDAEKIIAAHTPCLPAEDCPLKQAHGRILRAPIKADRDLPPFDRVTMDGYAIHLADEQFPSTALLQFRVTGLQAAGMIAQTVQSNDTCVEIATGAVLPSGANAIVPYELATRTGEQITVSAEHVAALQTGPNIHRRGSDHAAGEIILDSGSRLSAREIAVAATCGYSHMRVSILPRIAIISTGDELVEVDHPTPAPHHVRRSNDHALRAALLDAGYPRVDCMHVRDLEHELEEHLKRIIAEHDVVILTGGVSKGKFDFVPAVLAKLGVDKKFQGVAQRPGKPFWFGVTPRRALVFALPGNPVSTYICFQHYVLPALDHLTGTRAKASAPAVLAAGFPFDAPLTAFVPAQLETDEACRRVARLLPANTSGDLAALINTDGYAELPCGPIKLHPGDKVLFHSWR